METTKHYTAPDGYRMIERQKHLHIDNALPYLSAKRRGITSATIDGEEVTATFHRIECPYCRRQIPAYFDIFSESVDVSEIKTFLEIQQTLFDESNALVFNDLYIPDDEYYCQYCEKKSQPFSMLQDIEISTKTDKVTISCVTMNPKGLLSLKPKELVKAGLAKFPVKELVEYNFSTGQTTLRMEENTGQTIVTLDLMSSEVDWSQTEIYKLLEYPFVQRKLRSAFSDVYPGGEIPFKDEEFTPAKTVILTRFVGFPQNFYYSIPYISSDDERIDASFMKQSQKIYTDKDLPALLDGSSVPNSKSVKRVMYEFPGMFFYMDEVEMLWDIIGDVNVFISILEEKTFLILSHLHQYPGTAEFFKEYIKVKGTVFLKNMICKKWPEVKDYSISYIAMNRYAKEQAKKNWEHSNTFKIQNPLIPMPMGSREIKDCNIDGYTFEWLHTKKEYVSAGEWLENCLVDWTPDKNPVLVIKKGRCGMPVAAVEMCGKEIIQARIEDNDPIESDEAVFSAFEKWKKQYGLSVRPD